MPGRTNARPIFIQIIVRLPITMLCPLYYESRIKTSVSTEPSAVAHRQDLILPLYFLLCHVVPCVSCVCARACVMSTGW